MLNKVPHWEHISGNGSIGLHIVNLKWVECPLDRRPGGPMSLSGCYNKDKNFCPCQESNLVFWSSSLWPGHYSELSWKCAIVNQFICMTYLKTWQVCWLVQNIWFIVVYSKTYCNYLKDLLVNTVFYLVVLEVSMWGGKIKFKFALCTLWRKWVVSFMS